MNEKKDLKALIYNELKKRVDLRIQTAADAMNSAEESRNNETKSSVGDKYETGRAMMHLEKQKNEIQFNKALTLKKELNQIDIKQDHKRAGVGSLVITNQGIYFISIGVGKVEVEGEVFYCISIAAPVGKLLHDRSIGESFRFQDRLYCIENII